MSAFFDYPKGAKFGRVLPKKKIYQHARASSKLQQRFVDQVSRIVWKYKLAPETINLDATKAVAEIQVFEITLRTAECDEDILRSIDKAIPYPLIFELKHSGKRKAIAAYKRPSEADSTKWVVSDYFSSEWQAEDNSRQTLPAALNLGALYDKILSAVIPEEAGAGEPVSDRVERMEKIRVKQREIARIKARMSREKQFNKRIAINAELRAVQQQFEQLTGRKT